MKSQSMLYLGLRGIWLQMTSALTLHFQSLFVAFSEFLLSTFSCVYCN